MQTRTWQVRVIETRPLPDTAGNRFRLYGHGMTRSLRSLPMPSIHRHTDARRPTTKHHTRTTRHTHANFLIRASSTRHESHHICTRVLLYIEFWGVNFFIDSSCFFLRGISFIGSQLAIGQRADALVRPPIARRHGACT